MEHSCEDNQLISTHIKKKTEIMQKTWYGLPYTLESSTNFASFLSKLSFASEVKQIERCEKFWETNYSKLKKRSKRKQILREIWNHFEKNSKKMWISKQEGEFVTLEKLHQFEKT